MQANGNPDRTWVEIDLEAVRENARTLRRRCGVRLLPMVKADGYGLGAAAVVQALEPLDPWGFGVVSAEEGAALRGIGVVRPVLVLQPTLAMLEDCARQGLTPVLGDVREVRAWLGMAGGAPFHVEVDTGMNRSGIWWEAFASQVPEFAAAPGFQGLATHFHSADRDRRSVEEQWGRFRAALAALPRRPELVHAANSAAALGYPEVAGDMARPGIFLYGGMAGGAVPEPVVSWRALVSRVAQRDPGCTVSYGATWRADRRCWVVTVAAGYADGVRRSVAGKAAMLLDGRRRAVAGAVTMDSTMLVSDEAAPDDAVATLIGTDGGETITVDEFASWAGTTSYEVLTGLGRRVRRVYRG